MQLIAIRNVKKKSDFAQNHRYQYAKGFTLPEVILALSFGSLIVLSAAQVYQQFCKQISILHQHYRLEQIMRHVVFTIEKDLRRAGFCHGKCNGSALVLGQYRGEMPNSCLIISYDLNRNGRWEEKSHADSEYFGYRLRNGFLESQRGDRDCHGRSWEKLLDSKEVKVTHFTLTRSGGLTPMGILKLQLGMYVVKNPTIRRQITSVISSKNI